MGKNVLRLRMNCIDYLKKQVIQHGYVLDFNDLSKCISVPYYHGNHDGNGNNQEYVLPVYQVYLDNDGRILLDVEGCNGYELLNVPTEYVYSLACFVKNVYLKSLD